MLTAVTGESFNNETTSFQPRLAINYLINEQRIRIRPVLERQQPRRRERQLHQSASHRALLPLQTQATHSDPLSSPTITKPTSNFEEEELTNFEVGVKATLAEGRVNLAAALYFMEWEDMVQPYNLNWDRRLE